jgi:hypothetical protein
LLAGRLPKPQGAAVIVLAAIFAAILFPGYASLFGAGVFDRYPLTLSALDPDFSLPFACVAGKIVYAAIGAGLAIISAKRKHP